MIKKLKVKLFKTTSPPSTPSTPHPRQTKPKTGLSKLYDDALVIIISFVDDRYVMKILKILKFYNAVSDDVVRDVIVLRENVIVNRRGDFVFMCKYFDVDFGKNLNERFANRYLSVQNVDLLPTGGSELMAKYGRVDMVKVNISRNEFTHLLSYGTSFIRNLTICDCKFREEPNREQVFTPKKIEISPYLRSVSMQGYFNPLFQSIQLSTIDFSQRADKKLDLIFQQKIVQTDRLLIRKLEGCLTGVGAMSKQEYNVLFHFDKILIDDIHNLNQHQTCRKLVVQEYSNRAMIFPSVKKLFIRKVGNGSKNIQISKFLSDIFYSFPFLEYLVIPESTQSILNIEKFSIPTISNSLKKIQIIRSNSSEFNSSVESLKFTLEESLPNITIEFKKEKSF